MQRTSAPSPATAAALVRHASRGTPGRSPLPRGAKVDDELAAVDAVKGGESLGDLSPPRTPTALDVSTPGGDSGAAIDAKAPGAASSMSAKSLELRSEESREPEQTAESEPKSTAERNSDSAVAEESSAADAGEDAAATKEVPPAATAEADDGGGSSSSSGGGDFTEGAIKLNRAAARELAALTIGRPDVLGVRSQSKAMRRLTGLNGPAWQVPDFQSQLLAGGLAEGGGSRRLTRRRLAKNPELQEALKYAPKTKPSDTKKKTVEAESEKTPSKPRQRRGASSGTRHDTEKAAAQKRRRQDRDRARKGRSRDVAAPVVADEVSAPHDEGGAPAEHHAEPSPEAVAPHPATYESQEDDLAPGTPVSTPPSGQRARKRARRSNLAPRGSPTAVVTRSDARATPNARVTPDEVPRPEEPAKVSASVTRVEPGVAGNAVARPPAPSARRPSRSPPSVWKEPVLPVSRPVGYGQQGFGHPLQYPSHMRGWYERTRKITPEEAEQRQIAAARSAAVYAARRALVPPVAMGAITGGAASPVAPVPVVQRLSRGPLGPAQPAGFQLSRRSPVPAVLPGSGRPPSVTPAPVRRGAGAGAGSGTLAETEGGVAGDAEASAVHGLLSISSRKL